MILARARPDLRIDAVDASPDMLRAFETTIQGEGLEERISLYQGTAERLSAVVTGPYDLIYSRDSLHHWDDPPAAFREIRSLLSRGASLFLRDNRRDIGAPTRAFVACLCALLLGPMGRFWKSSIAAGYTADEVRDFLGGAGFRSIAVDAGFLDLEARAGA